MDDATYKRWRAKTQRREDGCLIWTGARTSRGYGHMKVGRKTQLAHRLAYEHFVGPIPEGLEMDHLCRVRTCVDWQHLEPVTRRVNQLRGNTLTAASAAKTHCPAGHPYDEANTYRVPRTGKRQCRECHKARQKEAA